MPLGTMVGFAAGGAIRWLGLTFPGADERVAATVHAVLDDSWHVYESYTAPLGVGFMVKPGHHYGPDVDGYEYTAVSECQIICD